MLLARAFAAWWLLAGFGLAAADTPAADEAPEDRTIVSAAPSTEGTFGAYRLYGVDRDGRRFEASPSRPVWDGWELSLRFEAPDVRPDDVGTMIVCNEVLVDIDGDDQPPRISRACSPPWTALPEPAAAVAISAGAALLALLHRRRAPR